MIESIGFSGVYSEENCVLVGCLEDDQYLRTSGKLRRASYNRTGHPHFCGNVFLSKIYLYFLILMNTVKKYH